MAYCDNCGRELKDGELYCEECGAKVEEEVVQSVPEETEEKEEKKENEKENEKEKENEEESESVFCPHCGSKSNVDDSFCQECGKKITEEETAEGEIAVSDIPESSPAKKLLGKKAVLAGATAAVVLLAALAIPNLGKSSSEKDTGLLYLKDNEMYHYDGTKSLELTDRLLEHEMSGDGSVAMNKVRYSDDGKYVFYLERSVNGEGTLYYKDLKKQSEKNDTAQKISGGVISFTVKSNNKVIYSKGSGEDNSLYISDLKDNKKIASDVKTYQISEDGQNLIWRSQDDTLYYANLKKGTDKEKIDSDVEVICGATSDLKTVYYMKDEDTLYSLKSFVKEKIDSDVTYIGSFNDWQGIYYMKVSEDGAEQMSLLEDDMKEQDRLLTKPSTQQYKKLEQSWYGSYYTTDYDAYWQAEEKYSEKEKRDRIRENAASIGQNTFGDLYAYDGEKSKLLLEKSQNPISVESYTYKSAPYGNNLFIAYSFNELELPKVRISELSDVSDFEHKVEDVIDKQISEGIPAKLLDGGAAVDMKYSSYTSYSADQKNGMLYGVLSEEKKHKGDSGYEYTSLECISLEKQKYSQNGMEEPVTVDDDFNTDRNRMIYDGKLYYLKDYDDERNEGTLYCEGKEIVDAVSDFYEKDDVLYLMSDRSQNYDSASLSKYEKGKITEIADDVYCFSVMKGGKIAALLDYSMRRNKGDLYIISGKDHKKEKLDEDVQAICSDRGIYY